MTAPEFDPLGLARLVDLMSEGTLKDLRQALADNPDLGPVMVSSWYAGWQAGYTDHDSGASLGDLTACPFEDDELPPPAAFRIVPPAELAPVLESLPLFAVRP